MEYLSSEYSSPDDDSDLGEGDHRDEERRREIAEGRKRIWSQMVALGDSGEGGVPSNGRGKSGWPEGGGEKVLEVRKPVWRSEAVSYTLAVLKHLLGMGIGLSPNFGGRIPLSRLTHGEDLLAGVRTPFGPVSFVIKIYHI
jgi:hypothetical protein